MTGAVRVATAVRASTARSVAPVAEGATGNAGEEQEGGCNGAVQQAGHVHRVHWLLFLEAPSQFCGAMGHTLAQRH
jgi:hypothetical protein